MHVIANGWSDRLAGYAFALIVAVSACSVPACASETVLYSFHGGSDGLAPVGALIADGAGNLYGTTEEGGGGTGCSGRQGCGTIFKLAPDGTESELYAFTGISDGAFPQSSLLADKAGNLYGTTWQGGSSNAGTVFKLAPDGTEAVRYAFTDGSDGGFPSGGVVADANGNLYGTTSNGGNKADCGGAGCGVMFEIDSSGHESVLHTFTGGSDGALSTGGVIRDGNGNLYGEANGGGINCGNAPLGCGVVFKLAPGGTETVLHTFQGGSDGQFPLGGLLMDRTGNLYGTTQNGGSQNCVGGVYICGTVFEIASDGTEKVLHAFTGGSDGSSPVAAVVMDKAGNLYGTTAYGGGKKWFCGGNGCGTVFKLAPDGTETVLYAFRALHGIYPTAALLKGPNGLLYGTTNLGGTNSAGVVFSVHK